MWAVAGLRAAALRVSPIFGCVVVAAPGSSVFARTFATKEKRSKGKKQPHEYLYSGLNLANVLATIPGYGFEDLDPLANAIKKPSSSSLSSPPPSSPQSTTDEAERAEPGAKSTAEYAKVARGTWLRGGLDETYWQVVKVVHGYRQGNKYTRNRFYGKLTRKGYTSGRLSRITSTMKKDWVLYESQAQLLPAAEAKLAVVAATNPESDMPKGRALYYALKAKHAAQRTEALKATNTWGLPKTKRRAASSGSTSSESPSTDVQMDS
ncbi:hypothetical protein FVE85_5847 [Porphyridium purpureum]|uniref:Uncharacterized protein n=1 Tax=Porphyridium purpureum TaxID=35688 RepID=A0A5J4Z517_PORPP|nr:hypothetical protein FVE85_5847 [Porphyridium purpureum]|eukprot:POR7669..scf295_1